MYPHEPDESKKTYLIIAALFHIVLFLGVFIAKGIETEPNVTSQEIPPESSIQSSAEISDENLQKEANEEKKQEVEKLNDQSLQANAISAKEVENAIKENNKKIKAEKDAEEAERQEAAKKIAEEKKRIANEIEQKRLDAIALKKKIEDDKAQKVKEALEKKLLEKKILDDEKNRIEEEKKEKIQKIQALKEAKEKIEKAKAAEIERKQKSAEAIKKAESDRQSSIKKKALEDSKKSNVNRGYDSNKNSLSKDEKLAYLKAYRDDVYNEVYSNWIRPSYSKRGWECKVHVTQTNTGEVKNVQIVNCQGDAEFQQSVKRAIFKSSPLPLPKHPSLFNETIEIKFKVT